VTLRDRLAQETDRADYWHSRAVAPPDEAASQ
jgi:hypothetical protein